MMIIVPKVGILISLFLVAFSLLSIGSTKKTLHASSLSASPAPQNETLSITPSLKNQPYYLVHVGKTAGSKIACEFGFLYPPTCRKGKRRSPTNSTLVSNCKGVHHMGWLRDKRPNHPPTNLFLVSTRNPIDRIISWFNYEVPGAKWLKEYQALSSEPIRPDNCLFQIHASGKQHDGCFANVDELATNCTFTRSQNATEDRCRQLAWEAVRGTIPCAHHNQMNYKFYMKQIRFMTDRRMGNPRILAIRSEFLGEDWDRLESMFGGAQRVGTELFQKALNPSKGSHFLSSLGLQNLCTALCPEIQIYKQILLQAENIDESQYAASMQSLQQSCPEEPSQVRSCR